MKNKEKVKITAGTYSYLKISAITGLLLCLFGVFCIFGLPVAKATLFLILLFCVLCMYFGMTLGKLVKEAKSVATEKCSFCGKEYEKGYMHCPYCGTHTEKEPESIDEREKRQTHKDLIGLAKSQTSMDTFYEEPVTPENDENPDDIDVAKATKVLLDTPPEDDFFAD